MPAKCGPIPETAGEGYRFVQVGEELQPGDECCRCDYDANRWGPIPTENLQAIKKTFGSLKVSDGLFLTYGYYRRKIDG